MAHVLVRTEQVAFRADLGVDPKHCSCSVFNRPNGRSGDGEDEAT